jgi:hypothetical protein
MTTLDVQQPGSDSGNSRDTLTLADDDARAPLSGNRDPDLP